MARRRGLVRHTVLPRVAWLGLLALLPWWLGLPLLLALVAVAVLLQHRLDAEHAALIRRSLRWGLPGVLFALQRGLGGDVVAWGAALLGALAGYTMLAGVEAWLDRELRRAPLAPPSPEWPELAMAAIGPPAEIIELQSPLWQQVGAESSALPAYRDGAFHFADGSAIADVSAQAACSPSGRWFIARMRNDRGIVLLDRERQRQHRLPGWQLCGWYREQPWLSRGDDDMPLALAAVLGHDDED